MNINEEILVYNYEVCTVIAISSNGTEYDFDPARNGVPYERYLPLSEIKSINGKSSVFRNGMLRFEKDKEEEIYKELKINNYKEILTNEQIQEILLHPKKEGLTKILAITSPTYFERVRGIFLATSIGDYDVSMRIKDLLEKRFEEFKRNQIKTSLVVSDIKTVNTVDRSEIDELTKKIKEQEKLIEKLLALQNSQESQKPKTTKTKAKETE